MPADFVEIVEEPELLQPTMPSAMPAARPSAMLAAMPSAMPAAMPSAMSSEPVARTIHLMRAPLPSHILHRLIRPKFKYWHFQFHEKDEERLLSLLRSLESGLTVLPNFKGGKDHPDIAFYRGEESVGKIQFIHLNRSDLGTPSKYYMDAYISCTDAALFDKVEDALFRFVEAWSVVPKTRKQRRYKRKTRKYKN